MPQPSTTDQTDTGLAYIEAAICASLKKILDNAFGSNVCSATACAEPSTAEDRVWFTFDFVPAQFGSISFGADRSSAIALGHRLLANKRRASEHDHHALHATGHLLNLLAASLAEGFSQRANVRLDYRQSAESEQPPAPVANLAVEFSTGEHGSGVLSCAISAATTAALDHIDSSASIAALASRPAPAPQNLDLLLDLEMPVTVSFGATRLPLNEIARLTTGSIVELNRTVAEPVDIVVNNCAIARGEVVVVEGNFAVRIKQIMSRQDRLRSLT
jgi:flagellar motor switch protein FliN/FliY